MLADRIIKKWERDFERAGMQKWMQEGRQQGQASLLGRQLSVRFGPLPEWIVKHLDRPLRSRSTIGPKRYSRRKAWKSCLVSQIPRHSDRLQAVVVLALPVANGFAVNDGSPC
ncbi:hypothetical protein ACYCFC_09625 [Stutzerimonas sp. NM35]